MPAHTNKFQLLIGGKDAAKNVPFPIKWNDLLDERLDEARISIKQAKTQSFAPLTDVYLKAEDSFGNVIDKYYLVSNDFSVEAPPGSGKYEHEIVLIEQTKYLEGFLCDTLTFTNDLGRNYTNNTHAVIPTLDSNISKPEEPATPNTYITPLGLENFTFFKCSTVFPGTGGTSTDYTMIITRNGSELYKLEQAPTREEIDVTLNLTPGLYSVYYKKTYKGTSGPQWHSARYDFLVVENTDPLPKWTIKTVIERLLEIAETRRQGDSQKFTLDPALHNKLDAILAPEFAFTSNTLKEVLDQIGGFIHAIPRLKGSVITFDFLGGTEMSEAANYPYIYDSYSCDVENFATKIDSRVDNLVNILDDAQGVLYDPYLYGFKTLRTEQLYARLEDGNMIIETAYPIQEIKAVRCGTVPMGFAFDITPYIFEEADYARMSSIGGEYPKSKAYAVYFTQGQKNIKGLDFKAPHAVDSTFYDYAIVNILNAVAGGIGTFSFSPDLLFQVSYIPVFSARVEQTKSYIGGLEKPRTLAYNQGANLVETRYYGENLKGVIARTGNTERTRTFIGKRLSSIPKVGQLFDKDYYIASVTVEFLPFNYKCTLGLSKDFNRISQYIGIDSVKRYYEVSEKQAYDRQINYTDYLIVGDSVEAEGTLFSETEMGLNYLLETILQSSTLYPAGSVNARGITSGGNAQTTVTLPLISNAFGNSIVFSFSYADNFSAGNQVVPANTSGKTVTYYMQGVAYGDVYGQMEYLHFKFNGMVQTGLFDNISKRITIGRSLPAVDVSQSPFIDTGERPLLVKKDNKEVLSINYQIEVVSNRSTIVIGSAFSRNCPFVRGSRPGHAAKLYVLPNRISKFEDVIDLTGATLILNYEGTEEGFVFVLNGRIIFDPVLTHVGGKSWALVDGATNELLIGENTELWDGDYIMLPTITPRHNIYNI